MKKAKISKTRSAILTAAISVLVFLGCDSSTEKKPTLDTDKNKHFLSVEFSTGEKLRYKFISKRDIEINWGTAKTTSKGKDAAPKIDKSSESFEMVVSYEPLEVNPFALTTIKATCESIKTSREPRGRGSQSSGAVRSLIGKSYTFSIDATGKIKDYSQLENLIQQAGKKAFRTRKASKQKIKNPDMIADFVTTQWFLWDSLSTIKNPASGVSIGQNWNSALPIPAPMMLNKARTVTYKLTSVQQTDKGHIAAIDSSYTLSEKIPPGWPKPYPAGRYQVSGKFGFLRNYQLLDLNGQASERFNIDTGRIESSQQQYTVKMLASMMIPITKPKITIKQTITMQLLDN